MLLSSDSNASQLGFKLRIEVVAKLDAHQLEVTSGSAAAAASSRFRSGGRLHFSTSPACKEDGSCGCLGAREAGQLIMLGYLSLRRSSAFAPHIRLGRENVSDWWCCLCRTPAAQMQKPIHVLCMYTCMDTFVHLC
jgi:hypothetical protein